MTTSYSEICPFGGGSGGSSGRSSALGCGSDTLLSPDLSPATPDQPPPSEPGPGSPPRPSAALLDELEQDARRLAAAADGLIESLTGTMYSISSLAVDSMDAYRDAVCKTCDNVDANIKVGAAGGITGARACPPAGVLRFLRFLMPLRRLASVATGVS